MNFSIFEDTWRVPRNDLIAANPVLAANPAFAPLLVAGEDAVVTPHEGGWLICAGGCVHHAGVLHLPSSASRKIAWPTVAVYAGVAGVAGWWLWRRRDRARSIAPMLMALGGPSDSPMGWKKTHGGNWISPRGYEIELRIGSHAKQWILTGPGVSTATANYETYQTAHAARQRARRLYESRRR